MEVTFTHSTQSVTRIAICLSRFVRLRTLISASVLLLLFNSAVSAAVLGKLVQPYGSYGFTADDNILRIRDGMNPLPLLGTNNLFDMSHRFTGGVLLGKDIGRQQFNANLSWTHTRFKKFDQMNNNLKNFSGSWHWFPSHDTGPKVIWVQAMCNHWRLLCFNQVSKVSEPNKPNSLMPVGVSIRAGA